jgi:protein-S-isoprenylcysteine O-methyltransferase Ste14
MNLNIIIEEYEFSQFFINNLIRFLAALFIILFHYMSIKKSKELREEDFPKALNNRKPRKTKKNHVIESFGLLIAIFAFQLLCWVIYGYYKNIEVIKEIFSRIGDHFLFAMLPLVLNYDIVMYMSKKIDLAEIKKNIYKAKWKKALLDFEIRIRLIFSLTASILIFFGLMTILALTKEKMIEYKSFAFKLVFLGTFLLIIGAIYSEIMSKGLRRKLKKKKIFRFVWKKRSCFTHMIFLGIILPLIINSYYLNDNKINHNFLCAGEVLIIFGVIIRIIALQFRLKPNENKIVLVDCGIYSIIRHPRYTGNFLIILGFLSIFNYLAIIITGIGLFAILYYMSIIAEEDDLKNRCRENGILKVYNKYKNSVPRFIPNPKIKYKPECKASEMFNPDWKRISEAFALILISFLFCYLVIA